ncbi:hypothetical protein M8C21_011702 [Ambrosia artemisiifolia]|uniref:Uncharacterized protein n=1 Tax=Ambrosia artemisiifolia TaxID=4212 RepID=A0AAD5C1Y0_AMBAR|nr:hypothetical protein M8C21_011702 [Ambrosia artemisiifolia]
MLPFFIRTTKRKELWGTLLMKNPTIIRVFPMELHKINIEITGPMRRTGREGAGWEVVLLTTSTYVAHLVGVFRRLLLTMARGQF